MTQQYARPLALALVACAMAFASPASFAENHKVTKKVTKPSKAPEAKPAPLADLSPEQLSASERVLTGPQQCEFNQSVDINQLSEKAGYFQLGFKGKKYLMAPEPTTTGAVRLEDKKAGVVWLQIANKSMLMNAKIGQRMVDDCVHHSQQKVSQPS